MMRFLSFTNIALLSLASQVAAHGVITSVTIDGKVYAGANGMTPSSSSPMRQVSSGSPVQDLTSNDMICGLDAKLASGVASAKPGSLLQFDWIGETGIPWFHNTGPILTYMTSCSNGDCSSFEPTGSTKWFKISELGEKSPGTPNTWVQADLNSGAPANITIPDNLPDGDYLLRHEIIALQNSQSVGGAELYPACLQVRLSGGPSGNVQPSSTVTFPGAYSPTDPGLLGNFYNPGVIYTMPGGPVSNFKDALSDTNDVVGHAVSVNGGSSATAISSTPSSSAVPKNAAPTPSSVSSLAPSPSSSASTAKSSASSTCKRKRDLSSQSHTLNKARGISMHKKRRLALDH